MIKLRTTKGKEIELPDEPFFIEVCDKEGNVGMLFYQNESQILQVLSGTKEAERYEQVYGRAFCPSVIDISSRYQ